MWSLPVLLVAPPHDDPEQTQMTVFHDKHCFSYLSTWNCRGKKKKRSFRTLMVDKWLFMCAEADSSQLFCLEKVWKRLNCNDCCFRSARELTVRTLFHHLKSSFWGLSHQLSCISAQQEGAVTSSRADGGQHERTSCWAPPSDGLIWADLLKWTSFCCLPK